MTELSRRTLLTGAAALALAPAGTLTPARAAVPPAGKQVPGIYRQKLGDF
jgi:hypothetical protein